MPLNLGRGRLPSRRRRPPPLPWRRPRWELLILVLVALATLTPVYPINAQDVSRLCLTRALLQGQLSNDPCLGTTFAVDRASYGGHYYSDKAPGMSVLEVPAAHAVGVPNVDLWLLEDLRIWAARVLSSGVAFLVCVFLLGRISEGIAPGFGGLSMVTFGLGTLAAPFAGANFAHGTAGTLAFGAFVLAWRRRPVLAGLAAGAAVLVAYEVAVILAVLAVYLAFEGGWALARYLAGVVPGAAILAAYDWAAFGSPFHLSYRYVAEPFAESQAAGFFGIHSPTWHGVGDVFVGSGGLLVVSPVLAAAGAGLWLLGKLYPAEAAICAVVTLVFLLMNVGYYDPYGGLSPGPRFLIPALPFLCLGLGPVFERWFRVTVVLAALSIVSTTAVTLTWSSDMHTRGAIWGELARVPGDRGSSRLVESLASNVVTWLGPGRSGAAALVALAAAAAFTLVLVSSRGAPRRTRELRLRGRFA